MYMIINWSDDFVESINSPDGSIKLFSTAKEAHAYADKIDPRGDDTRVISIDNVKE